jgi:hypothetical protein
MKGARGSGSENAGSVPPPGVRGAAVLKTLVPCHPRVCSGQLDSPLLLWPCHLDLELVLPLDVLVEGRLQLCTQLHNLLAVELENRALKHRGATGYCYSPRKKVTPLLFGGSPCEPLEPSS